jgi:hypothetical protein
MPSATTFPAPLPTFEPEFRESDNESKSFFWGGGTDKGMTNAIRDVF